MKLKLVIYSAKDLNDVKHLFGTMNPYVIVSITGGASSIRTETAKGGGSNPVWTDESMEFSIEENVCMQENQVITFMLKHDGTAYDRTIGQVQVPLKNFLLENASGKQVSYPVMGENNGTITISYTLSPESDEIKAVQYSNDVSENTSRRYLTPLKLKLVVHSAKDLKDVKHFSTMNPYAIISLTDCRCRYRTSTLMNGGSNPVWNSSVEFVIHQDACKHEEKGTITFKMKHDGRPFDRTIGKVELPLKNLINKHSSGEKISYPLMGGDKGSIIISYTLGPVSEVSKPMENPFGLPLLKHVAAFTQKATPIVLALI